MSGFTKGPWGNGKEVKVRGLNFLSHCHYETSEGRANAHLIAAAPDMYDELEKALKNWIELIESGDAGFWDPEKDNHVISMRKVLAKARGET